MTGVERLVVRLMADATQYNRIFNTAESRILTFMSVASAVTIEAGRHALQLAADYEEAAIAFKVLTGSAENGAKMLADIDKFAIATPYTTEELRKQAQTMAGFGVSVDNILPSLKALGDITAGVGGGTERLNRIMYNFSQVMAQGRPYWIDIKQFAMAGINIQEFARTAGVSVAEFRTMVEAGEIGADNIANTFNRLTAAGGKFNNLMGDLSNSARGRWRQIREQFDLVLRDIGLQILQSLKDSGAFDYLQYLMDSIRANGPQIKQDLTAAFSHAREIVAGILTLWTEIGIAARSANDFFAASNAGGSSLLSTVGQTFGMAKADADQLHGTFEGFVGMLVVIPAALTDAMNVLRLGMFTILAGLAHILVSIEEFMNKTWNQIADGAKALGLGDWGKFGRTELIYALKDEFIGGAKESRDKIGETSRALDAYVDRLIAAKKAGKDLTKVLKDIPPIRVPKSLLPPDLMKFIEETKKNFREHGDPFEEFQRRRSALEMAARLGQLMPDAEGAISNEAANFGALKIYKELQNALGKGLEPKLPSVMLRGSKEAQDTINKANMKGNTVQEQILDVLNAAKVIQEQTKIEAEEIRKALQDFAKKGIIKKGI